MIKNKKGFITGDTFQSPGFWILVVLGWSATILGWKLSKSFGSALPTWQILATLVVIFFAAAFFARE